MTEMKGDRFTEIVQVTSWVSIDEIRRMLDKGDYWSPEFEESALDQAKNAYIRHQMRQIKDPGGFPLFASVKMTDDEGDEVRVYKPETLFDLDDYRQAANYHADRAHHHILMSAAYRSRGEERYKTAIQLEFDILEGPDGGGA